MSTKSDLWEAVDLPTLSHKVFTNAELVEQYLILNEYWWTTPENTLYNKRDAAKSYLMYYLDNGEEPEGEFHYTMDYVVCNFRNDYLPHFRRVS